MLAAAFADVLGANSHPFVGGRVGDHPLHERAVLLLCRAAAVELRPRLRKPGSESVTHPLQLSEAENPRSTRGADPPLDVSPRRRGEEIRQLALHAGDLGTEPVPCRPQFLVAEAGEAPCSW